MPNSPVDALPPQKALKRLERDQVSSALSKQDPGQRRVRPPIARRDRTAGSAGFLAWHWHRGPNYVSLLCRTRTRKNWSQRCMRVRAAWECDQIARRPRWQKGVGASPARGLAEVLPAAAEIHAGPTDHRQWRSGPADKACCYRRDQRTVARCSGVAMRRTTGWCRFHPGPMQFHAESGIRLRSPW